MTPLPVQWELNSFVKQKLSVFIAAGHVSDSAPLIESSSTPRWLDKVFVDSCLETYTDPNFFSYPSHLLTSYALKFQGVWKNKGKIIIRFWETALLPLPRSTLTLTSHLLHNIGL